MPSGPASAFQDMHDEGRDPPHRSPVQLPFLFRLRSAGSGPTKEGTLPVVPVPASMSRSDILATSSERGVLDAVRHGPDAGGSGPSRRGLPAGSGLGPRYNTCARCLRPLLLNDAGEISSPAAPGAHDRRRREFSTGRPAGRACFVALPRNALA